MKTNSVLCAKINKLCLKNTRVTSWPKHPPEVPSNLQNDYFMNHFTNNFADNNCTTVAAHSQKRLQDSP
jgi:hypothetical protein